MKSRSALLLCVLTTALAPLSLPALAAEPAKAAPAAKEPQAPPQAAEKSAAEKALAAQAALAALPARATELEKCMVCHGKDAGEITLESGEVVSLKVDLEAMLSTAHRKKVVCTDCHQDLLDTPLPHKDHPLRNKREFAIQYSEGCRKCHASNYTDTLDSVHRAQIAKGKNEAAVCADCHGSHDITAANEPRSRIAKTCANCHEKISKAYIGSVHGLAITEGNPDVPTCTDCHRSHAIADPRGGPFKLSSPELCGGCHSDAKLMAKYKLSPNVLQSYLSDFHGTTVMLQKKEGVKPVVALCTDCHGVHDITKAKDKDSKVVKANLLVTCKKCHKDAQADFPASWLSHYEPTLDKAPLVFAVRAMYLVLIPFMIGGLALQIVLHLWRMIVNR
jgi:predicted CXXCH cytochrome family protein